MDILHQALTCKHTTNLSPVVAGDTFVVVSGDLVTDIPLKAGDPLSGYYTANSMQMAFSNAIGTLSSSEAEFDSAGFAGLALCQLCHLHIALHP